MANDMGTSIVDKLKGYFGGVRQTVDQKIGGLSNFISNIGQPPAPQPLNNPVGSLPDQQLLQQSPQPQAQPTPTPTPQPSPSPQPENPFAGITSTQVPDAFTNLILQASKEYNINPSLLAAMLNQESRFNPTVLAGPKGSVDRGISQINEKWHPEVSMQQALDPSFAIPWMANNVRKDADYFGGDLNRAIAGYNVGRGGASVKGTEAFGGGPKGQSYLDNVLRNLDPTLVETLGLKPSESLMSEFRTRKSK